MMPSDSNRCPECRNPVPADSQHRICPSCLMAQALASRTVGDHGGEHTAAPPSPAEIARHFPQFEILQCLGRGGMGVVYKARQKSLDRMVAIKILPPERVGEAEFADRFAREAQTLAKLNHPNIVVVFDHGETDGLFHIVMEYVDGVNLRDLLRDGKLEPAQALAIVPPICEALQYAHGKGIVHRDIKPENLLLDRSGRIKIADFGIAALIGADGDNIGTPPYMAPEQAGLSPDVDLRADIYALGVVLYEMLTGERPSNELVVPSKKAPLDVRLDAMVLRALEKNPQARYQTADEFRTVVETVGRLAGVGDARIPVAGGVRRERHRKKVKLRLAGGIPDRGTLLAITASCLLAGGLVFAVGAWVTQGSNYMWATVPTLGNVTLLPAGTADGVWVSLLIIVGIIVFLTVALVMSLWLVIRGTGSGIGKGLAAGFLMLCLGGLILITAAVGAVLCLTPRMVLDPFEKAGVAPLPMDFRQ